MCVCAGLCQISFFLPLGLAPFCLCPYSVSEPVQYHSVCVRLVSDCACRLAVRASPRVCECLPVAGTDIILPQRLTAFKGLCVC